MHILVTKTEQNKQVCSAVKLFNERKWTGECLLLHFILVDFTQDWACNSPNKPAISNFVPHDGMIVNDVVKCKGLRVEFAHTSLAFLKTCSTIEHLIQREETVTTDDLFIKSIRLIHMWFNEVYWSDTQIFALTINWTEELTCLYLWITSLAADFLAAASLAADSSLLFNAWVISFL